MKYFFLICLTIFLFFKATAEDLVITPGDNKLKIEDRLLRVEKAVRDLQEKSYSSIPTLNPSPSPQISPPPVGAKYLCEINVIGKYFYAYGKSKLETKNDVTQKCRDAFVSEVHCIKSDCKIVGN